MDQNEAREAGSIRRTECRYLRSHFYTLTGWTRQKKRRRKKLKNKNRGEKKKRKRWSVGIDSNYRARVALSAPPHHGVVVVHADIFLFNFFSFSPVVVWFFCDQAARQVTYHSAWRCWTRWCQTWLSCLHRGNSEAESMHSHIPFFLNVHIQGIDRKKERKKEISQQRVLPRINQRADKRITVDSSWKPILVITSYVVIPSSFFLSVKQQTRPGRI